MSVTYTQLDKFKLDIVFKNLYSKVSTRTANIIPSELYRTLPVYDSRRLWADSATLASINVSSSSFVNGNYYTNQLNGNLLELINGVPADLSNPTRMILQYKEFVLQKSNVINEYYAIYVPSGNAFDELKDAVNPSLFPNFQNVTYFFYGNTSSPSTSVTTSQEYIFKDGLFMFLTNAGLTSQPSFVKIQCFIYKGRFGVTLNGNIPYDCKTVTNNYTITALDNVILVNNTTNITITLPFSTVTRGRLFKIIKISNNTHTVTVQSQPSEKIYNTVLSTGELQTDSSSHVLFRQFEGIEIINVSTPTSSSSIKWLITSVI